MIKRIVYYLDLVVTFIKLNLKKIMEYRIDFIMGIIPLIVTRILGVVFIGLVFQKIPKLNGWSFEQVLLIYSFYTLASGVYQLFFENLRSMKAYIFSGTFDSVLIRPLPPLLYILMLSFNEYSIGQMIVGTIIMGYAWNLLMLPITVVTVLLIIFYVFMGAFVLGAISLLSVTILFYTEGTFSPLSAFHSMEQFVKYPLAIFNKYIQVFLTWVLPLGFISFYPAIYFIPEVRKPFPVLLVTPIIVFAFFSVAVLVFNSGFKRYTGTGN